MFKEIYSACKNYSFEIMVVGCVVIILIISMFRIGKTGSWNQTFRYTPGIEELLKPGTKRRKGIAPGYLYGTHDIKKRGPPKLSAGEKECRRVLESIFNRPFPNIRPNFLRNPVTGGTNNLEIDCYCESLRLGCEYSGKQHYEYSTYMHKNKEAFHNQKYRDELKRRMCRDNDVMLMEVPYTVKHKNIEGFIIKELRKLGMIS
jgi:hypothetical protein